MAQIAGDDERPQFDDLTGATTVMHTPVRPMISKLGGSPVALALLHAMVQHCETRATAGRS